MGRRESTKVLFFFFLFVLFYYQHIDDILEIAGVPTSDPNRDEDVRAILQESMQWFDTKTSLERRNVFLIFTQVSFLALACLLACLLTLSTILNRYCCYLVILSFLFHSA